MKRPLLLPLVPLYAGALALKRRFAAEPKRLTWPVISVGSLSAGGAGKTPVVAALAKLLAREGYHIDVLSRGYGRASDAVEQVDPAGSAERFGDEPLLLAQTGVPVFVGADRYSAGVLAERGGAAHGLHLLDDGFQHRRLARAIDLVLLTQKDVEDRLLPAGDLREPWSRLRASDVVVLREEEAAALRPVVERLAGSIEVWTIQRALKLPGGRQRPLAFCGIARPEGFFTMLRDAGIEPAATIAFADHHRYRDKDVNRLMDEAQRCGADGFLTTEKDRVKIGREMQTQLSAVGPLAVARLQVEFGDEAAVARRIATTSSDHMRR